MLYVKTNNSDLHGQVTCREILSPNSVAGLDISGDIDADITVLEGVHEGIAATGGLASNRTILIGESLSASMTLPSSGLSGQVIVNANNTNPASPWTGSVTVGSTTLSPVPAYSQTSASLGGGAVGLAPFRLHTEDIVPQPGDGGTLQVPLDSTVRLRWYGPLEWTSGNPVTVEWDDNGTWQDISNDFTCTFNPGNPRELRIVPDDFFVDWAFVTYRIRPTSNLRCAGVAGTPSVYSGNTFEVTFAP